MKTTLDLWSSPFGWGVAMYDYDLDGDLDMLTHGGLGQRSTAVLDNPGLLINSSLLLTMQQNLICDYLPYISTIVQLFNRFYLG